MDGTSHSAIISFLRKKGLSNLESLSLSMYFGAHSSADDAKDFLAHTKTVDVIVLEGEGWTSELQRITQSVCQGDTSPKEAVELYAHFHEFFEALYAGLHNSKKRIAHADIPAERIELLASQEALDKFPAFLPDLIRLQWSRIAARQIFIARLTRVCENTAARESCMADELGPAIFRALDYNHNHLLTSVSVLTFFGANHAVLYDFVKQMHPLAKAIYQRANSSPSYFDEVFACVRSGSKISADLADNLYINLLLTAGADISSVDREDRHNIDAAVRRVVELLTDTERELLHTTFSAGDRVKTFEYIKSLPSVRDEFGVIL